MFETPITVVGNIVNKPDRRWVGDQELIKFRLASNSRRRNADGEWEPGNTLFVTVNCWGKLITGVGAALGKGDAVIVVGYVYTSEYEDKEGVRRSSVEVRATSVGPDLARCIARIEKRRHPDIGEKVASEDATRVGARPASEADENTIPGSVDAAGEADPDAVDPARLPLSA
ncbi:single-stranded DNA-binding protein [Mycolicibacterium thermoresistibile]